MLGSAPKDVYKRQVFDYLLAEQEVDRSMFDRQIDLIMSEFAPVAQKYLKHVAKVNGLEKMTFADWKMCIRDRF